jgi:hypothetical protein
MIHLLVWIGLHLDPSVTTPGVISSLEKSTPVPTEQTPAPAPAVTTPPDDDGTPDEAPQPDDGSEDTASVGGAEETIVDGGAHWRIETSNGPVHVWLPMGYDAATAGVVIYVHGYWTDVDTAWVKHDLAAQFSASNKNAMFIVPEAQENGDEDPRWKSLRTLIDVAATHTGIERPEGPVVISGHSGAFEQLARWIDRGDEPIDHVILYDALYGGADSFYSWLTSDAAHKLTVVANHTLGRVRRFKALMRLATREGEIPVKLSDLSKRERNSRFLFMASQFDHYAIITSHKVIPLLLGRTPLADVTPPAPPAR